VYLQVCRPAPSALANVQEVVFLKRFKWATVTVDEGHRLKNSKSKLSQMLTTLKSDMRVLLTGTPLQNNLEELLMLLAFVEPTKFDAIKKRQVRVASNVDTVCQPTKGQMLRAYHVTCTSCHVHMLIIFFTSLHIAQRTCARQHCTGI
jgi:SNF2 family DNA or RNA helicase